MIIELEKINFPFIQQAISASSMPDSQNSLIWPRNWIRKYLLNLHQHTLQTVISQGLNWSLRACFYLTGNHHASLCSCQFDILLAISWSTFQLSLNNQEQRLLYLTALTDRQVCPSGVTDSPRSRHVVKDSGSASVGFAPCSIACPSWSRPGFSESLAGIKKRHRECQILLLLWLMNCPDLTQQLYAFSQHPWAEAG